MWVLAGTASVSPFGSIVITIAVASVRSIPVSKTPPVIAGSRRGHQAAIGVDVELSGRDRCLVDDRPPFIVVPVLQRIESGERQLQRLRGRVRRIVHRRPRNVITPSTIRAVDVLLISFLPENGSKSARRSSACEGNGTPKVGTELTLGVASASATLRTCLP